MFHIDLKEVQRAESAVLKLLQKTQEAWFNQANGDADIWVKGKNGITGVEIKTDFESLYTNNICIEPQTLDHTKSDFFIYLLPQAYIIETPKLRQLYKIGAKVQGGDQNLNLALIEKEDFKKTARLVV